MSWNDDVFSQCVILTEPPGFSSNSSLFLKEKTRTHKNKVPYQYATLRNGDNREIMVQKCQFV